MQRAYHWESAIREGRVTCAADVARVEGLTRARVCQIMKLLQLSPQILADIEGGDRGAPMIREVTLRALVGIRPESVQIERYLKATRAESSPRSGGRKIRPESKVRRKGFQHLFDQARSLQGELDRGDFSSLRKVARHHGITATRVGQLLNILHLAPDILAAVDVPTHLCPLGLTAQHLRAVSRLRSHEDQRELFDQYLAEGRLKKQQNGPGV